MIFYYLRESLKSLTRFKFATLITIVTTCIAILFTTLSVVIVLLSNQIDSELKSQIEVNLFVEEGISDSLQSVLKTKLNNDNKLASATFIDKETAAAEFKRETGEDFSSVLSVNPLPSSYRVKFNPESFNKNNVDSLVNSYKEISGITDVVYDYGYTLKLLDLIKSVKFVVYISSVVLLLLSLYLVFSNNRLIINQQEKQFSTMKLVGAKLSSIRIPILLNGLFVGIIAGALCIGCFNILYYFFQKVYNHSKFMDLFIYLNATIFIFGILFGILGGLISVSRITLNVKKIQ